MVVNKLGRTAALILTIVCIFEPLSASAALRAYVDRNPVVEDESFTLTVESDGDTDGSPDLSPLHQDFDVQGQGKSSNLSIINGAVSRKTQWQISLMAKHSGQVQIPSINVGSERTQPLTVTVTPASQAQAAPGGGDLFMDVNVTPHSAYVQQQVIYTVRLFHAVDLANGSSLSEPTLPGGDAVVEKLGKDKRFETVRNGMRYDVIERSYAIYPQKSGGMDIPSLTFDGIIVQGGGGNGGFFNFDPFNQTTRHKRLRSQAEHIEVKPIPAAFHGGQWLPARSLQLDENWSPDPPKFTVGQAVTRTIAIMADGLTASQLPALDGGVISGLKQYPDQPSLKDTKDSSGVTGLRTEKIAYIPTQTGSITLPAVKIVWWNTATNRMEEASLPARTFTVLPGATASGANPPPVPAVTTPPSPKQIQQTATTSPAPLQPSRQSNPLGDRWQWLALVLGLGWLATLGMWWWRARSSSALSEERNPPEEESLRRLIKTLQANCTTHDAAGTKSALLAWARHRWPQDTPLSLTAIARRCPKTLSEAIIELDRALYAQTATNWQGQHLWQEFVAHGAEKESKIRDKTIGLEPLYRS